MLFVIYLLLYGLLIVSGIVIATWLASRLAPPKVDVWEALSFVLIFGLIGARLYHVANFWNFYATHLLDVFKIWQGGLGIFGGIFGGLIGLAVYSHLHHLHLLPLLDLAALATPLAQAIGRFGNLFNQELFGLPTTLPWGIYIDPTKRPLPVAFFEHFHPLALYESLGCLLIFSLLVLLTRLSSPKPDPATFSPRANYVVDGRLFFAYITLYGLLRYFLETLRIEPWTINNVNVAQALSVIFIVTGITGILWIIKNQILKAT